MEWGTLFFYSLVVVVVTESYYLKHKDYNWFAIIVLTFVLGLRGNDNDTLNYIAQYWYYVKNSISLFNPGYYDPPYDPTIDFDLHVEWFYLVLFKILRLLPLNSVLYFFVCDFICILWLDKYLQRYKAKEKAWIVFFFFVALQFIQMLNVMRQFVAFMILLNAYEYIYERKCWHYFVSVVVMYLFHKSAIVLLPLYLFMHKDLFRVKLLPVVLYGIVVVLSSVFVDQLKVIMDAIYLLADAKSFINTNYFNSEEQVNDLTTGFAVYLFRFSTVIYLCFHSEMFKKTYKKNGVILLNFTILGIIIKELAYNRGVERFNIYFDSFLFITLGLMVFQSIHGYYKFNYPLRFFTCYIVLLYIAWFSNCVLQGAAGCAPYVINPDVVKLF